MNSARATRVFVLAGLLTGTAVAGLFAVGRATQVVAMLGLPAFPWANRVFDAGLMLSFGALAGLAIHLLRVLLRPLRSRRATEARAVTGTVMVEFAMVLPLLLLVAGLIVQLALVANAALVVRYSAFVGARAAIVRLEPTPLFELDPAGILRGTEGLEKISRRNQDEVKRAAVLVLATISPQMPPRAGAASTDLDDAIAVANIYDPGGSYRYPARVAYADANTTVTVADRPSPYKPDDPHLVAPFSDSAIPVLPPPVLWEPPKSFNLVISLEKILEILGKDSPAIGIMSSLPLKMLSKILEKILPPFGFSSPTDADGFACTVNLAKAEIVIRIPIPKVIVDALTVRASLHPFPEQVEVQVEYRFLVTIPGMNLVPGLVGPAPPGVDGYGVFTLTRSVQLQSTGVREGSPLAILYGDPSL